MRCQGQMHPGQEHATQVTRRMHSARRTRKSEVRRTNDESSSKAQFPKPESARSLSLGLSASGPRRYRETQNETPTKE